jgi:hypothetical protein
MRGVFFYCHLSGALTHAARRIFFFVDVAQFWWQKVVQFAILQFSQKYGIIIMSGGRGQEIKRSRTLRK